MTVRRLACFLTAVALAALPAVAFAADSKLQPPPECNDGTEQAELTVTLSSTPFPPMLELNGGSTTVTFDTQVDGGLAPYSYAWDLDGDGEFDAGLDPSLASTSHDYPTAGKYTVMVQVTDVCGMMASDTLPVLVVDPEAEACQPMAQRIADAVNSLFPNQATSLYSCEDILDIFVGGLTGSHIGFGRLWHAYQLSQSMEDLTWEELRDWHLDQNGWGALVQLNRMAQATDEVGLRELYDMVVSGEASLKDLRSAMRAVSRYGADFDEALSQVQSGMNPGELNRYYRDLQQPDQQNHGQAQNQTGRDTATAAKLARQYGVPQAHVWSLFDDTCSSDWQCVRAALRQEQGHGHGGGKP